ncbi:pimeloyl-ACP methyl ester esterase BioH [Hydrogenophilus islandicus]
MTNPVVLIPGWRLGRGPLTALADALNASWYDLPGYRETPFTTDFAEAVDRLVTSLPEGAVVVGWSLGGMFALAAAAQAPQKVAGAVVISATPSFVTRPGWPHGLTPEALAEFRTAIAADEPAMLPRFIGGFLRGEPDHKTLTAQLLSLVDPAPELPVLLAGLEWLATVDLRPLLPTLTQPVLVIHGEADPLIPCAAGRAIADAVPHGQLLALPQAAHAPFLRHQEVIVEAISTLSHPGLHV